MADWKVRGYVPDSDEEEDSQDILPVDRQRQTQDRGDAGLAISSKHQQNSSSVSYTQVARQPPTTQAKAVEVRIVNASKPDGSSLEDGPRAVPQGEGGAYPNDDMDLDELQDDHYNIHSNGPILPPLAKEGQSQLHGSPDQHLASGLLGAYFGRGTEQQHIHHTFAPASLHASQDGLSNGALRPTDIIAPDPQQDDVPTAPVAASDALTIASSPLTEVSSEISNTYPRPPDEENRRSSAHVEASPPFVPLQHSEAVTNHGEPAPPPCYGRSFRQRKAIQLHPYVIEGEKYRQFLHDRGVKAVRIEQAVQADDESQVQEFQGSPDSGISSPGAPLRARSSSSTENGAVPFADDELPDMDVLLRQQNAQLAGSGYKRRRLHKPTFKRPPSTTRPPEVEQTGEEYAPTGTHLGSIRLHHTLDVPPSPPSSRTPTPAPPCPPQRVKFRRPPAVSPKPLPTPATSSEPRAPLRMEMYHEADTSGQTAPEMETTDDSDAPTSPSVQEIDPLRRVKDKIRGVLPASWAKLDLKNQPHKSEKNRAPLTSPSPERRNRHRGVARPVLRPLSNTNQPPSTRQDPSLISDEDVSSENDSQIPASVSRNQNIAEPDDDDAGTVLTSRWGEADEGEEIDAMLPTERRPFQRRKHKLRQSRTVNFGMQSTVKAQIPSKTLSGKGSRSGPLLSSARLAPKPRRPKFHPPPKLSILDAPPSSASISPSTIPSFLTIASRTARARKDRGRHSPSRKFLRLATRDDTLDANVNLEQWRMNTIAPKSHDSMPTVPVRRPLIPRSSNSSLPSRDVDPTITKASTKQIARRRRQPVAPRKGPGRQTSLAGLVHNVKRAPRSAVSHPSTDVAARQRLDRRPGQLLSSLQRFRDRRPATLETLQGEEDQTRPKSAFSRHLQDVELQARQLQHQKPLWDQFGNHGNGDRAVLGTSRDEDPRDEPHDQSPKKSARHPVPRPPRKRRPQRVDVSMTWQEQLDMAPPSEEQSMPIWHRQSDVHGVTSWEEDRPILDGLGPFGTIYTSTFDMLPFPQGACFHQSTFIGSGEFKRSLHLQEHALDQSRGFANFTLQETSYHWGPWNESVSSDMGNILEPLIQPTSNGKCNRQILPQLFETLRRVVVYASDHLHFLDPVDRLPFLQRCTGLLKTMMSQCRSQDPECEMDEGRIHCDSVLMWVQVRTLGLAFANQLRQLSHHSLVSPGVKQEVQSAFLRSFGLLRDAFSASSIDIERTVTRFSRANDLNLTIRDNEMLQALIIAQHISGDDAGLLNLYPKEFLINIPQLPVKGRVVVGTLEKHWKNVFALQPCLEFDSQGVLELGKRFKIAPDDWVAVRKLVSPVLEIYLLNMSGQGPSFNAYCRALFSRCLHLINSWGWRRCDAIIGTLFDFFARNHLNHLRHEESHGSPLFLEQLENNPALTPEPEDRCFHLLLKIIGSGVRHMRLLYPEKKIRDLVWRLMPNHGRSHPKEYAIRQEDLDALRNHHDLLCTLYWASPPGLRPRLTVIRNLVHVESSHKEACHINIRTWANLVNYQLSTDEPMEALQPFQEWFSDLLHQILRQHGLARTEAEEQVRSIQHAQGLLVSQQLLETTISTNQRQVEAMICDVLACLQRAITLARAREAADALYSEQVTAVFSIFDSARPQTNGPIVEALKILLTYTAKLPQWASPIIHSICNEDSQDYGDWCAFSQDDGLDIVATSTHYSPLQQAHEALRQLLSNCFGADTSPADSLLSTAVDTWVAVSHVLVKAGTKSWSDYLGSYGKDSWSSLRNTDQKRKYTAYYLAALAEKDSAIYTEQANFFLRFWIESLVERESRLKFQHKLTSALLNVNRADPLFSNLPFWSSRPGRPIDITPREFSERRLSLISSLLSDMRSVIERKEWERPANAVQRKQEYRELLRHLMTTMKHNYQELGQASNVRGAYVDFVHRIIEFLQEYTTHFCPIDRFFTDNASFPLPVTDPNYVVGQLKNYGLRIQDPRAPKELAVFLQSVSERAAVDNQQGYLADQLHTAISNTFEHGSGKPTLRAFIIKAIVPAYAEMAFTSACGWILALPFLQAVKRSFKALLNDLDGCHVGSVQAMASVVTAYLRCIRASLLDVAARPLLFQRPPTLKAIRAYFSALIALLPTLDYLARLNCPLDEALDHVRMLKTFTAEFVQTLPPNRDTYDLTLLQRFDAPSPTGREFSDISRFALDELRSALDRNWIYVDGTYFVSRGNARREVLVEVGLIEDERAELEETLKAFRRKMKRFPAFGGEETEGREDRFVRGLDELIL